MAITSITKNCLLYEGGECVKWSHLGIKYISWTSVTNMDAQWWIRGGLSRYFLSLLLVSSVFLCLSLSLCAVCLVTPSRPTLCSPINCSPSGSSIHGDSPGKNTGVGCPALLQGILSTQRSNQGLPHCRQILYCLSQQGSPRIQKWVAYPFSTGWLSTSLSLYIYLYLHLYIYSHQYLYM